MTEYKVEKSGRTYLIRELKTGFAIVKYKSNESAYRMVKHLNLGGGFGGVTPEFFLDSALKKLNTSDEMC